MPAEVHESPTASSSQGRSLRRTVSVPSEGQFPEYPAEAASMLGETLQEMYNFGGIYAGKLGHVKYHCCGTTENMRRM